MIQLQFGDSITSVVPRELKLIDLDFLADAIIKPLPGLDIQTDRLRRVGGLDIKAYQKLKKELPYITCGIFNPPYRKTENFTQIECLMIDFDHLSEKETTPEQLKKKLQRDDRVALMFTSPGGDGLKVLVVLKEPFRDVGKYTLFYKLFIAAFARDAGLTQVVDKRTSDATRATFLCHDAEAYYNPLYQAVDVAAFIDFDSSLQVDDARSLAKEQETEHKQLLEIQKKSEDGEADALPDEILLEIKKKLNPKYRPMPKKRSFYVPEKVLLLENELNERCNIAGIEIIGREDIQYGRQLAFAVGGHQAELNIFYGKKGFSVVKSTKTACSDELNDLVYNLVMELIVY
ncbi:MAG: CRISPR-associated primase-polymerase type B [Lentimicrobiaceae bacterium]|nr:CRISPR-associated primase-polymerase type B [Lentimicrobiaceae bacterium]